MGRRPWSSRLTVEACPIHLCATRFRRLGIFWFSLGYSGTITWSYDDRPIGALRYQVIADGETGRALFFPPQHLNFDQRLRMSSSGQTIHFTVTRPHRGGVRYWFRCECGRRSGRLYLGDYQVGFRCRICYDLTYRSSQEHCKRLDALKRDLRIAGLI
jgi:hypothetical protein